MKENGLLLGSMASVQSQGKYLPPEVQNTFNSRGHLVGKTCRYATGTAAPYISF
jgi:hypothetical protein